MEFLEQVKAILSELSGIDSIDPSNEIQRDLGLDSLHLVMLLIMLEDAFKITLDESDMNPFELILVQNVVELVEKYVGGDDDGKSEEKN